MINSSKCSVMMRYDIIPPCDRQRAHEKGRLSAPRSMLAGLGAGMMEAIIAVTPSETIKYVLLPLE